MSNLLVYSTTPNWKVSSDITKTRLKDLIKEEIIVFKVKILVHFYIIHSFKKKDFFKGNFMGNL